MKFPNIEFRKSKKVQKFVVASCVSYFLLSTSIPIKLMNAAPVIFWSLIFFLIIHTAFSMGFLDSSQTGSRLSPPPRKFNFPCQIVFSKIRTVLRDTVYGFGDKWHVITADVQSNEIVAEIKLAPEGSLLNKAYLRMRAQIQIADKGYSSILIIKFDENSEARQAETYGIADQLVSDIDKAIGSAQIAIEPRLHSIKKPSFDAKPLGIGLLIILAMPVLGCAAIVVHHVNSFFLGIRTDGDETIGIKNDYGGVDPLTHRLKKP